MPDQSQNIPPELIQLLARAMTYPEQERGLEQSQLLAQQLIGQGQSPAANQFGFAGPFMSGIGDAARGIAGMIQAKDIADKRAKYLKDLMQYRGTYGTGIVGSGGGGGGGSSAPIESFNT